jgi:hypothetical protein
LRSSIEILNIQKHNPLFIYLLNWGIAKQRKQIELLAISARAREPAHDTISASSLSG